MSNQSRYAYEGTEVLINKMNYRDEEKLNSYERQVTADRLAEMEAKPVKGKFDLLHLRSIHNYLFQEIYPNETEFKKIRKEQNLSMDKRVFRGRTRDEDIMKGSFKFAPVLYMENGANELFSQLKKENFLKGMEVEKFSERLSYYMAEINFFHPFREGNGRVTREFIRELALNAGYELNWSELDANELLHASIRSVADTSLLTKQLRKAIRNEQPDLSLRTPNKEKEVDNSLE